MASDDPAILAAVEAERDELERCVEIAKGYVEVGRDIPVHIGATILRALANQ